MLGVPVVVLLVWVGARTAWAGDLAAALPALATPLGLAVSGAVMLAGAAALAWYQCPRCGAGQAAPTVQAPVTRVSVRSRKR
ncbi:hypothetical protein [Micromonospora schwarzwaldensis]|uniref:hypothetical protein n=1 Tax=Micromonospora sp. DSM 45708 TaxID=3111767 RepID=UPI0031D4A62C